MKEEHASMASFDEHLEALHVAYELRNIQLLLNNMEINDMITIIEHKHQLKQIQHLVELHGVHG
jgi:hypothetical protein